MTTDPRGRHDLSDAQLATIRRELAAQRLETEERIVSLGAERQSIVESAEVANIDDEHDPEGATIAYERALVISLLDTARSTLAELDAAESAIAHGTCGSCSVCAGPIGAERLMARPTALTCVDCAYGPSTESVMRR
ncbi:TraR/DksA C4-type zinc finger protein [soil metagenome]